MLHGSSVQHSHFDLTMWYIACFCLKSPSPDNLQLWCLASLCPTGLLKLVFLPFDLSCTPVCHPSKGPNCGSRPHCHLPVWNQRKPSACRLLAEGGESGKSKQSPIVWCVENSFISFIAFSHYSLHVKIYRSLVRKLSLYTMHLVLSKLDTLFGFPWLYAQLLSAYDSPALHIHTHIHTALQTTLSVISIFTADTQKHLLFSGATKRQCVWQSANRFPVTQHW